MRVVLMLRAACLLLASTALAIPVKDGVRQPLSRRDTYQNPTLDGGAADPWVLPYDGNFYLLVTTGGDIAVRKTSDLTNFNVDSVSVWNPSGTPYNSIWAPEPHQIDGQFYIYASMQDTDDNASHRMYAFQGTSSTDPTAPFNLIGKLNTGDDNWAIDGTVFQSSNGNNYFIWSGWTDPGNGNWQNLYIAQMSSPTALQGDRVLLHEPNPTWQQTVDSGGTHGINEGPEILINGDRVFLVYSVAGSWTQDYALALMGLNNNGDDPLNTDSWWTLDDRPVMQKSTDTNVYGPGHASFPLAADGTPVIVYHAMSDPNAGWGGRTVRSEAFKWNSDGSPYLPTPPQPIDVDLNKP